MSSESADRKLPANNALNVRITVTRIVTVEADLPTGPTVQDAVVQLNAAIDFPGSQATTSPVVTPISGKPESKDAREELRANDGSILALVEQLANGRVVITPKITVAAENSPFSKFLMPRVLAPMAQKHPTFRYHPTIAKGSLVRLELEGLQEAQWKDDLLKPILWTLDKSR